MRKRGKNYVCSRLICGEINIAYSSNLIILASEKRCNQYHGSPSNARTQHKYKGMLYIGTSPNRNNIDYRSIIRFARYLSTARKGEQSLEN